LGREVDESDSGCVPAEGGAEQGGGNGVIGIGFGRGVWGCRGEGDERVGEGEEVEEESGACLGGEEDGKEAAEGMYAAVGVGTA